jgi:outer membrane protein assembly factor BamD (BamD/ComL family)
MELSGVFSNGSSSGINSVKQNFRQAFQNLAQALQAGDLSGAQKAFAQIQQEWSSIGKEGNRGGTGESNSQNSLFQGLANALQKGDLSSAQQIFSQIQQNMKAHHHHRHGSPNDSNQTANPATANITISAVEVDVVV